MKTIDESYYRLEGVSDLLRECSSHDASLKEVFLERLAHLEKLDNYYRFAVAAVRLFYENTYNALGEKVLRGNCSDFDHKSHSSALAFYVHARICIESSKRLFENTLKFLPINSELKNKINLFRFENRKSIGSLIQKRDVITAHPHNENNLILGAGSWGTSGTIRFDAVDLTHKIGLLDDGKYRVNPCQDLDVLKEYLEEAIVYFKIAWK